MRIISWNCNGKFREKFKEIQKINADIYVIQECENPFKVLNKEKYKEFLEFSKNYIWTGENKNKGLAVFFKDNIKLKINNWPKYCLRNFLSLRINNNFDLVGVWACKPYIEEYYIYQNINYNKYNNKTVIIGDFNSNVIWDKKHGYRTHTKVLNELKEKGLSSVYHEIYNEEKGKESKNTFYMYRNNKKKYHIDHCFANCKFVKVYKVLEDLKYLKFSDHMPLLLEIY